MIPREKILAADARIRARNLAVEDDILDYLDGPHAEDYRDLLEIRKLAVEEMGKN